MTGPAILRTSFRRPTLLIPALLLLGLSLGWVIAGLAVWSGVAHGAGFPEGKMGLVFFGLLYFYARATRLTLDVDALELKQLLTTRRARWDDIETMSLRSYLEPTFRGQAASGIRLRLAGQAKPLDIPDVFTLPKRELAALLSARLAAHRAMTSPATGALARV